MDTLISVVFVFAFLWGLGWLSRQWDESKNEKLRQAQHETELEQIRTIQNIENRLGAEGRRNGVLAMDVFWWELGSALVEEGIEVPRNYVRFPQARDLNQQRWYTREIAKIGLRIAASGNAEESQDYVRMIRLAKEDTVGLHDMVEWIRGSRQDPSWFEKSPEERKATIRPIDGHE